MPFYAPNEHLTRPWRPLPPWVDLLDPVAFVTMLVLSLVCAFSLVLRFRRGGRPSTPADQVAGTGRPGRARLPGPVPRRDRPVLGQPTWFSAALGVVSLTMIPVATAIAVLRHDLYDVDKALAGAVTWGLLSLVLLLVYGVTSSAAGLLLGRESALVRGGRYGGLCPGPDPGAAIRAVLGRPPALSPPTCGLRCGPTTCGAR